MVSPRLMTKSIDKETMQEMIHMFSISKDIKKF